MDAQSRHVDIGRVDGIRGVDGVCRVAGVASWLAVPAAALWLIASLRSVSAPPSRSREGSPLRRLKRNAKWIPGITTFGGATLWSGWWLLPDWGGFAWSVVGVGVAFPLLAVWSFATGRLGVTTTFEVGTDEVRELEDGVAKEKLVDQALALPGFNQELLVQALGSVSPARFVVWQRQ